MTKCAHVVEIERKFLVKGDAWRGLVEPQRIRQEYMMTEMAAFPFSEVWSRKDAK